MGERTARVSLSLHSYRLPFVAAVDPAVRADRGEGTNELNARSAEVAKG
jgi:hypothetical protein